MHRLFSKHSFHIVSSAIVVLCIGLALNQYFAIMNTYDALIAYSTYIATGIGALLGLYHAYKIGIQNFVGKGLLFLGLSSLCSFLGYVLWDYQYFILHIENVYPSLAEYCWVLGVPFGIIGCLFLLHIYRPRFSARMVLEAFGVFLSITFLIALFVGIPDLETTRIMATVFNIFYLVTDAVWLSLAFLIIRIAAGKIFNGLLLYTIALMLLAIGDVLFFIRTSHGVYFYGDIADITMLAGSILTAMSIYVTAKTFGNNATQ